MAKVEEHKTEIVAEGAGVVCLVLIAALLCISRFGGRAREGSDAHGARVGPGADPFFDGLDLGIAETTPLSGGGSGGGRRKFNKHTIVSNSSGYGGEVDVFSADPGNALNVNVTGRKKKFNKHAIAAGAQRARSVASMHARVDYDDV